MNANYCTHAIEQLNRARQRLTDAPDVAGLAENIEYLIETLNQSVKFQLPDNGTHLGAEAKISCDLTDIESSSWHCPYPVTAFEFLNTSLDTLGCSRRIAIALSPDKCPNGPGDLIGGFFTITLDHHNIWRPVGSLLEIWKIHSSPTSFDMNTVEKFQGLFPQTSAPPGFDQDQHALNMHMTDLHIVLRAMAFMRCNNVYIHTTEPSLKLNSKRSKKGKPPFFQYKVLEVGQTDKAIIRRGGISDRASPRIHLRRGHIRRLPSGATTFVRQSVVGDKKKGILIKDYLVHQDP